MPTIYAIFDLITHQQSCSRIYLALCAVGILTSITIMLEMLFALPGAQASYTGIFTSPTAAGLASVAILFSELLRYSIQSWPKSDGSETRFHARLQYCIIALALMAIRTMVEPPAFWGVPCPTI